MAERLTNLIIELSENPRLLADFQKNPDAVAQQAGLSPAELAVMKSRDTRLIREAVTADVTSRAGADGEAAGITVVVLTYTRMPSSVVLDPRVTPNFETQLRTQLGEISRGGLLGGGR